MNSIVPTAVWRDFCLFNVYIGWVMSFKITKSTNHSNACAPVRMLRVHCNWSNMFASSMDYVFDPEFRSYLAKEHSNFLRRCQVYALKAS
jgi:hypothetical protein